MPSLSSFDIFPKVDSKCLKQTTAGGLTTISVYFLISFLFFWEVLQYIKAPPYHDFQVDPSIYKFMIVSLDISVATQCEDILVAVIDKSGESIVLNGSMSLKEVLSILIYKIVFNIKDFESGKNIPTSGCRISGRFPVNKVNGRLNIIPSPSLSLSLFGIPLQFINEAVNFSHKIHKLSFGSDYPGQLSPLEGAYETTLDLGKQFNYFISVVPTVYKGHFGRLVDSNQYAVHEYTTNPKHQSAPGIFLSYDLEPISLIVDQHKSFLHTFIVRLCGIIGGVYALSTFLFNIAFFFTQRFSKEPNYQALQ